MEPALAETIYCDFVTSLPTTGAASDADSLPTCEVFEDATDTATLSPTVVKRTGKTGNYRIPIACTSGNGFEAGKTYNVIVSATVGGVAAKAAVQTFQVRTNDADDLATSILTRATPANVATELATVGLTTTVTGRIDAAVSTRSTYAGADTSGTTTLLTRVPSALTVTSGKVDVNDKTGFSLTAAYDPAKTAAQPGNAMTLTSPYDAAKTAATQTSVDSKASQASVDAIKAVVDAIKVIDDRINTAMEVDGPVYRFTTNALEQAPTGSGGGTAPTANEVAAAVLKIDWTTISGEAVYSLLNAARMLRNVWNTPGGVLHVKKEDGTTDAWTRTLAVDPTAQPIVGAS